MKYIKKYRHIHIQIIYIYKQNINKYKSFK